MSKILATLLLTAISLMMTVCARAQQQQQEPLRRRAHWGASISPPTKERGALVRRVEPNSPAEKAGLKAGDVILKMNGVELQNPITYDATYRAVRAGDKVNLRVLREGKSFDLEFVPAPLLMETIKGVEVRYESVVTDKGHRLRTIITKPVNQAGRLPTLLFVQWLSCDSIESPLGPNDGWSKTLHALAAKSGFVLVRVERPGLGDSLGPACAQSDLLTDMAGYRAALRALKKYDFVDSNNLFLLGGSLGGALAPVIAQGENVRGLIVSGGFTKTWYEHMLEIERRRLELVGRTPAEINESMRGYSEFYSMYLNQKLTPAEVIRQRPRLAALWDDQPEHQYGRPAAFFHQVQELNIEAAWAQTEVPVLIIYGEYDWIMSRQDQELAAGIINRQHPGRAKLVIIPRMDHNLDIYESMQKAFAGEGASFDEGVPDMMIQWLKSNLVKSDSSAGGTVTNR